MEGNSNVNPRHLGRHPTCHKDRLASQGRKEVERNGDKVSSEFGSQKHTNEDM